MKPYRNIFFHLLGIYLLCGVTLLPAVEGLEVPVFDQTLTITRFPAEGKQLIIWVAPSFDSKTRAQEIAAQLAARGIEVWRVDLADSLFLLKSTSTLRSLSGKYLAGLIEQAHIKTGKRITLLARSYAAIPVLRGARQWQINQIAKGKDDAYLNGAILFSPELYATVPALGLEPVYVPEVSATNIPIMIYQSGKRGNRWQLRHVLEGLQRGGAAVYLKVLPDVTGIFYEGDESKAAADMFSRLPGELSRIVNLLEQTPLPLTVPALPERVQLEQHGLDLNLKAYVGKVQPQSLDLRDVNGKQFVRNDFKGKVTVMNFWATWCPPCVEEIPSLNRLRQAMQGKPFELISIDYAEDKQRVEKFLQQVNVDFPVLLDNDGKVSASWGVLVFPSTFVIGADGIIHYGVNGGIVWDSPEVINKLNSLLDK